MENNSHLDFTGRESNLEKQLEIVYCSRIHLHVFLMHHRTQEQHCHAIHENRVREFLLTNLLEKNSVLTKVK